MFENKTELQAREEILGIVESTVISITIRRNIRKETEFHMHQEYMMKMRW